MIACYDWACFRYDLWNLDGVDLFRSPQPRPIQPARYVTVLGAASAFGRHGEDAGHCATLGIRVEPFSNGGGAHYFLNNERILELVNGSAACVVPATPRVRAAIRNTTTSVGKGVVKRTADGGRGGHPEDLSEAVGRRPRRRGTSADSREQGNMGRRKYRAAECDPRAEEILWLSSREPDYEPDMKSYRDLQADISQLVDTPKGGADPRQSLCEGGRARRIAEYPFYNRFTGGQGKCFFGSGVPQAARLLCLAGDARGGKPASAFCPRTAASRYAACRRAGGAAQPA